MKKTLIALMALCGISLGEEFSLSTAIATLDSTSSTITLSNQTGNSYYMTVILNAEAITAFVGGESINKTIASLTLANTSAGLAVGTSSGVSEVKGATYAAGTALSANNSSYWTNGPMPKTSEISEISDADYVAISFGITGSKNTMGTIVSTYDSKGALLGCTPYCELQYVSAAVGTSAVLTGAAIDTSYINQGFVYTGSYDQDTLLAASSAAVKSLAVPEPTTATLSLLALAGLAVRRRRR